MDKKTEALSIRQSEKDGITTYNLTGKLTAQTAHIFNRCLDELHDVGNGIHIDLSGLSEIDSIGLQSLSKLAKVVKAFKKEYKLINVNDTIYDVLQRTGYADVFTVNKRAEERFTR